MAIRVAARRGFLYVQGLARSVKVFRDTPQIRRSLSALIARTSPRQRPGGMHSGSDLVSALHSKPAQIIESFIPGASAAVDVIADVAKILDTSLAKQQCAPGFANWPACAIPGGSGAALVASGMSPQQAAAVVAEVIASGHGLGGGGGSGGDVRPRLREN